MWQRMNSATGKTLSVGVGCTQHSSADQIFAAVTKTLGTAPFEAIRCIATIESKARQPGLLEFCARHALALQTFSRAEIATVTAPPTPSAAARKHLGIEGVCEPCALLAAPGGRLIANKTVLDGVTVAIASNASGPLSPTTEFNHQQDLP
ncbi:cobalt-precorrin 5A hydrolase [Paraburkholderia sp. GAS41]|jgi:cobalt-precorrin 5A hydrolase|uniref:cobalamin biosynthesis protein n=1 Tax=Paraburkholderia sp. GAS41 TaxID=3035134 RepID=UPI003D237704